MQSHSETEMNSVTLQQLGEMVCESIAQMSDAERAELRRSTYEQLTGRPFRGAEFTLADEVFLKSAGVASD